MNSAIKGQFYKRFISNSIVKFHGNKIWELNVIVLYPNLCYNEVCYKGTAMCFYSQMACLVILSHQVECPVLSPGGV